MNSVKGTGRLGAVLVKVVEAAGNEVEPLDFNLLNRQPELKDSS